MKRRSAFTLVELVVVVLILGILAAIAAPKVVNNSDGAGDSAVASTLASIRDGLEMYQATYNQFPPGTTTTVDVHAALDEFLRGSKFPVCTVGGKNSNVVKNVSGAASVQAGTDGWVYSIDEHEIIINSAATLASGGTDKYSEL